jgi:hypothetical protein
MPLISLPDFAKSLKIAWGGISVALAAGPLAALGPELHPPWPVGSAAIAMILSATALFLAFARYRLSAKRQSAQRHARRKILIEGAAAMSIGVVLLVAYLSLFSAFVIEERRPREGAEEESVRFVIGTTRLPHVAEEKLSDLDLLRDHLYEPESVWTRSSLTSVRTLLMATFGLAFAGLSYGSALISAATAGHRA